MAQPNIIHLANGQMKGDTDRQAVKDLIAKAVEHKDPGGMVVHFHGGLIAYNAGIDIANKLHPVYDAGGALPVFFVWESGLWEIVRNNIGELAKEHLFKLLWKRVANMVKRKLMQELGMKNAGKLPPLSSAKSDAAIELALAGIDTEALLRDEPPIIDGLEEMTQAEMDALERELMYDAPLTTELREVSASLRTPEEIAADMGSKSVLTVRSNTRTLLDPAAVDRYVDRPTPNAKGIISAAKFLRSVVMIAARVIKRYIQKRDHGFHATVVEEIMREYYLANIGGAVWELMKKDTADAFQDDADVYGGTCFLTELKAVWKEDAPTRVTLVGHSTGAIYIAEFMATAERLFGAGKGPVFDVVFLAPAATFECCAAMLENNDARLGRVAQDHRRFRMFTMSDENERNDQLIPKLKLVYPHSLLYFISGVLEKDGGGDMPIVGMQRYFDARLYSGAKYPEIVPFRTLVEQHAAHGVWSKQLGDNGLTSASLNHGDFDDDQATRSSLIHILKHGF